jgi:hypothetical protein
LAAGSANATTTSFGIPDLALRDLIVGALAADYRTRGPAWASPWGAGE